jgi:hypothetical protein
MLQLNQIYRQIYFIAVKPVEVEVQMYVLSIFDIDAAEMVSKYL